MDLHRDMICVAVELEEVDKWSMSIVLIGGLFIILLTVHPPLCQWTSILDLSYHSYCSEDGM